MQWRVEQVKELTGYTVEWAEEGNYILSRRNTLYRVEQLKAPFRKFAVIDAPYWRQSASISRLIQRLLRFQVTNVVPLSNGDIFVTFDKSVGIIRGGIYRRLNGLVRPCRVLRAACAYDDNDNIFFGEYIPNEERGEVNLYRYSMGSDSLEVVHTFPPKSIRHVHGIYFDEFTRSLFCLTGDDPDECQIIQSFDGFRTHKTLGSGDETWRAVSLLFTKDCLFYGMDAEFRANHIYKFDRKTGKRESLGEVNGTVFYCKRLADDFFFTTTAENAPSQIENVAALWHVEEAGRCTKVISFAKDRWNAMLFQFGTIQLPYANKLNDVLYFSLVAVKGDNKTFRAIRVG